MLTHDVVIWNIRIRKDRKKAYQVRWKTGPESHSKSFLTSALADNFRSDLLQAAKHGEFFDVERGLPVSLLPTQTDEQEPPEQKQELRWLDFARQYVADRWDDDAGKTREGTIDALATATLALLDDHAARLDPQRLRPAVRWTLLPESVSDIPEEYHELIEVLSQHTLPMSALADPDVAQRLQRKIGQKPDGKKAATTTAKLRRNKLNTALEHAVEQEVLAENPLRTMGGRRLRQKRVARDDTVDRRVVANPRQVREMLAAVSYVGSWRRRRGRRLVAFYATLYYAGTRPAEALGLRKSDCHLPDTGWGMLTLHRTRPASEKKFTNSGRVHDERGLKHLEDNATRPVPIPPLLVAILRRHIEEFGTVADGRIFHTERGTVLGKSTYSRVWREARQLALAPERVDSPLAGVPYDLRHAALSLWLNGGVDPTDVAERAGNSVEVLLKRYAKCIDGRRERNNRLIEQALGDLVHETDDSDEDGHAA